MAMIKEIIERQRDFFWSGATLPVDFRLKQLKKLHKAIGGRSGDIEKALADDLRRHGFETFLAETTSVLMALKLALKKTANWARPARIKSSPTNFRSSDQLWPEPLGVTLIISPWNYPFQLALAPLIAALSAGNCVVLKPSELAPATSALLRSLLESIFPPEYVAVIEGDADTAQELLSQKFDKIFFTGSTRVGRLVMKAAAENLTPVILELGGKCPTLVTETADLDVAARRIIWGKLLNAGQTCIAPDYILVHRSIENDLTTALIKAVKTFYGSDIHGNQDYPRLINSNHFDRLIQLLDQGKIVWGGGRERSDLYLEPTIMRNVNWGDPIMAEEIFGPILPILAYDSLEEMIALLKPRPKPLALYLFTGRPAEVEKIWTECSFGGGCVNDTISHFNNDNLPFGGVGESGQGAYHGRWGFDGFSHFKSLVNRRTTPDWHLRYPPYSDRKTGPLRRLLSWLS